MPKLSIFFSFLNNEIIFHKGIHDYRALGGLWTSLKLLILIFLHIEWNWYDSERAVWLIKWCSPVSWLLSFNSRGSKRKMTAETF